MDKDKLKELLHPLFNKISNICLAAGSNREILKQEGLYKLSDEDLEERISHIIDVLGSIEENAKSLNKALGELYELLAKEATFQPPEP
ncbi:MAG: hypothetical protein KJ593_02565 [Candidatus Omnitrophica bacterium]|nr:hypothetical protein [Candidatus Omnitrophota bacterium]